VDHLPDSVVRRWFSEVWNKGREQAIHQLMAPDALIHGLGDEIMIGPAQFVRYFRTMHTALRPIEVTVVRTVVDGEMVAAHCHVTARHAGPSLGPPTGCTVDFWGMIMARVVDGQIVEGWNCFDFLTMYQQFGWVRTPPGPQAAGLRTRSSDRP
jgi:predicted SnoaL-like aldol condensation-catalyzing enzyme